MSACLDQQEKKTGSPDQCAAFVSGPRPAGRTVLTPTQLDRMSECVDQNEGGGTRGAGTAGLVNICWEFVRAARAYRQPPSTSSPPTAVAPTHDSLAPDMYLVRADQQAMKVLDASTLRISGSHKTATFYTYWGVLPQSGTPIVAFTKEYDCAGRFRDLHFTSYDVRIKVSADGETTPMQRAWEKIDPGSSDSDNESAVCHSLNRLKHLQFVDHAHLLIDYLKTLPH